MSYKFIRFLKRVLIEGTRQPVIIFSLLGSVFISFCFYPKLITSIILVFVFILAAWLLTFWLVEIWKDTE